MKRVIQKRSRHGADLRPSKESKVWQMPWPWIRTCGVSVDGITDGFSLTILPAKMTKNKPQELLRQPFFVGQFTVKSGLIEVMVKLLGTAGRLQQVLQGDRTSAEGAGQNVGCGHQIHAGSWGTAQMAVRKWHKNPWGFFQWMRKTALICSNLL